MIAIGKKTEGYREVLGLMLGDRESEARWSLIFSRLKSRNLRCVELVVADVLGVLVKAVRRYFQGVTWHRCQTLFMRNIMDSTPKSAKEELYPHLRAILEAPDIGTARLLLNQTLETFEKKPTFRTLEPHEKIVFAQQGFVRISRTVLCPNIGGRISAGLSQTPRRS